MNTPITRTVVFKFIGVSPKQLARVHEVIRTCTYEENLNPERSLGEVRQEPEHKPWANLVRSEWSKDHNSYLVEISVATFADCFRQASSKRTKFELARRDVLDQLFDSLGIFLDAEQPVYV